MSETLNKKVDLRAGAGQIARWKAAAERARRKFSDWVRLTLDEAAEREEGGDE